MISHQSGLKITSQTLLQALVLYSPPPGRDEREFIKVLRSDSRKDAFDLCNRIDLKELKEAYMACISQPGI
jgi:hypothetical protein